MNEEELKKLIEEYDKNVQILEKQQEKKNISWLELHIKKNAKDEFEAEMFMREEINFLQEYTKTKRRAQKELDFIRVQADKFGFNFVPFAASYANEFYPAAKDNDLNQATIHNLLIAITEYAAAKRANSEMLSKLIADIANLMKTGTYPENSSLEGSLLNIDDEIKETLSRNEKITSRDKFYENFANLLHYKYRQQALDNIDPVIAKINRVENKKFDHDSMLKALRNIFNISLSVEGIIGFFANFFRDPRVLLKRFLKTVSLPSILLWIQTTLTDISFAENKKKERYKNGYYMYDKYQGEREFFTPEEQDKLYGVIKKYNPGPYLFWRKAPSNPYEIPPDYENNRNNLLNMENNNSLQNEENLSVAMQDTEQSVNAEMKNNTVDISSEVKRILADTIDDFVQLRGFKKNKIT